MLVFPTISGFSQLRDIPSEIEYNIKLDVLCDWIEGSVLFDNETVSMTDVVDILTEESVYNDSDLASNIVGEAWSELKRRIGGIKQGNSISFIRRRIKSLGSWKESPAHSFCMILSMPQCYRDWSTSLSSGDYNEQGRLFELLTKASIEHQFSGWEIHRTGWSSSSTVQLSKAVDEIATLLGEKRGDIEPWENPRGKDAGLDLLCYRPFPDNRVGVPVYLMQCASGTNWVSKLHEPDLNVWTKIILFAATPRKAFAIPFALPDKEFKKRCNRVDGMLLDRYRLLAAANHNREWISGSLGQEIIDWVTPRLDTLRRYNE